MYFKTYLRFGVDRGQDIFPYKALRQVLIPHIQSVRDPACINHCAVFLIYFPKGASLGAITVLMAAMVKWFWDE